jgi:hypothetical protein
MNMNAKRKPVILNDLTSMESKELDNLASIVKAQQAPTDQEIADAISDASFNDMKQILDQKNLTASVITKEFVFALAGKTGEAKANGLDSMPYIAQAIFYGTCFGTITKQHVKEIYEINATKGNANTYAPKVALDKDSLKTGVSCLNVFAKMKALTQESTPDIVWNNMHKVTEFVRNGDPEKKAPKTPVSLYSKFLKIARYMNNGGIADLSDDTIKELLSSEPILDPILYTMEEMHKELENKLTTDNPAYFNSEFYFTAIRDTLAAQIKAYKLTNPNAIGKAKKEKKGNKKG